MADKTLISQYDGTLLKVGDLMRRLDRGAAVPEGADPDHVRILVERGMLAEGEAVAGATGVDPDAPPPFALPAEAQPKSSSKAKSD